MFKGLKVYIFLFAFSAGIAGSAYADVATYARSLSIEFDSVEGATSYEVEVQSVVADKPPQLFKSNSTTWKAKLRPGRYQIRLRACDERGVPGPWGEASPLEVLNEPAQLITPTINQVVQSSEKKSTDVEFTWTALQSANKYRIKIYRDKNLIDEKTTTETSIRIRLDVAQSYAWTVEGQDRRGIWSELQDPPGNFSLRGAPLDSPEWLRPDMTEQKKLKISWRAVENAGLYNLKIEKKQPTGWSPPFSTSVTSSLQEKNLDAADGIYRSTISASADAFEPSPEKTIFFEIDKRNVVAWAENEEALKENRIFVKSQNYWILLNMISATYSGNNTLYNSKSDFKDAQGVGITIGSQHDGIYGKFGLQGMLSYKTFSVQSSQNSLQISTIHSYGLGTWTLQQSAKSAFKLAFGAFYDEAPEILSNDGGQELAAQYLIVAGPALGFNWQRKLSEKWTFDLLFLIAKIATAIQEPENEHVKKTSDGKLDLKFKRKISSNRSLLVGLSSGGGRYELEEGYFEFDNGGLYLGFEF